MAKDNYIRFRCEGDVVQRFETIAGILRRNASDLGRLVFEDFITDQEKKLGITGAAGYGLRESAAPYQVNSPAGRTGRTGKRDTLPDILRRTSKRARAAHPPKPQP